LWKLRRRLVSKPTLQERFGQGGTTDIRANQPHGVADLTNSMNLLMKTFEIMFYRIERLDGSLYRIYQPN